MSTPMKDEVQGRNPRECRGCGCHSYDDATGCFVCDMDAENIANTPTPIADSSEAGAGGLPFGIIDPKYASFYTVARLTAWSYGYAIALHGSFTRDLDLIAIPWTDAAVSPEKLIHQVQYRTGCTPVKPNASIREHGRIVWTLSFPEFDCPRFVDFSIIPPATPAGVGVEEIARAFEAGALAVHNEWCDALDRGESEPPRCPDFSEAARDYALTLLSRTSPDKS